MPQPEVNQSAIQPNNSGGYLSRDEIIRMAREADPFGVDGRLHSLAVLTPETLERFAALVEERTLTKQKARHYQAGYEAGAAAEREACAQLLEDYERFGDTRDCVAAIRARSGE